MILKANMKDTRVLVMIACVALIGFNVLHFFTRHAQGMTLGVLDGARGAFLGIAIGCVFLGGLYKMRR